MSVRKVSFEITDIYSIQEYRNFIKVLLSDEVNFEVFLLSNDLDTDKIFKIAKGLNLDDNHVIICATADDKLIAIEDYHINIHLDDIQRFVDTVNNDTDAIGVLINATYNSFYNRSQYIVDFELALDVLDTIDNGE